MQITLKSSVSTVMTYPYRVSCLSIVALTPNQPITSVLLLLPFLRADIVVVGVTAGRIERESEGASFVFCLSSPFSPLRWPDDPPTEAERARGRRASLSSILGPNPGLTLGAILAMVVILQNFKFLLSASFTH